MQERSNLVTMKGQPVTLLGNALKVGDEVPDCEVIDTNLQTVKLASFDGKVRIITTIPSLDTSVCNLMTRRFNEEIAALDNNVVVLVISTDLPFAQNRWCTAEDVQNVHLFSDHRDTALGLAFGVLIKSLRLLARSVFIVDKQGTIRYMEIVKELTEEPDYEAAMEAAKKLL